VAGYVEVVGRRRSRRVDVVEVERLRGKFDQVASLAARAQIGYFTSPVSLRREHQFIGAVSATPHGGTACEKGKADRRSGRNKSPWARMVATSLEAARL